MIVFATGFHATEYLFPMTITGRNGLTTEEVWKEEGARGLLRRDDPGLPEPLDDIRPQYERGARTSPAFHEMITLFALKGIEKLILEGKKSIDVRHEPFRAV